MANFCKCCGAKIVFMEHEWDYIVVDDEDLKFAEIVKRK